MPSTPKSMMSKKPCLNCMVRKGGSIRVSNVAHPHCVDCGRCIDGRCNTPSAKGEGWEKDFFKLWNECFSTGGDYRYKHQLKMIKSFISSLRSQAHEEGYKKGVADEIECVETSGEHKAEQRKLKSKAYEEGKREAMEEVEQLRIQLAGCGVAALGGTKDPVKRRDWGWSQSYQDVLDLRRKFDVLKRKGKV